MSLAEFSRAPSDPIFQFDVIQNSRYDERERERERERESDTARRAKIRLDITLLAEARETPRVLGNFLERGSSVGNAG